MRQQHSSEVKSRTSTAIIHNVMLEELLHGHLIPQIIIDLLYTHVSNIRAEFLERTQQATRQIKDDLHETRATTSLVAEGTLNSYWIINSLSFCYFQVHLLLLVIDNLAGPSEKELTCYLCFIGLWTKSNVCSQILDLTIRDILYRK